MASRPLVGVAGMRSPSVHGLRRRGVVAAEKVLEAVLRAGGEPVIVAPLKRCDVPDLHRFSALVVPGGADLDPTVYGGVRSAATEQRDPVQDRFDIALTRRAVALELPMLSICRGMQVLNVALGGTLVDDLPEDGPVDHRNAFHVVHLDASCGVAAAMGTTSPYVSSCHHQAIAELGDGLQVAGRADDGCIEVVAHATVPVLAVQWHPEDDADTAAHEQGLFDDVVEHGRRREAAAPSTIEPCSPPRQRRGAGSASRQDHAHAVSSSTTRSSPRPLE